MLTALGTLFSNVLLNHLFINCAQFQTTPGDHKDMDDDDDTKGNLVGQLIL